MWSSRRDSAEDSARETGRVYCVALSPDGRLLAEGGTGTMRLWDVASGRVVHVMREARYVASLAFHPKAGVVVSGGFNQRIQLWNAGTGTLLKELHAGADPSIETGAVVAFRDDSAVLASGGADSIVRLWDSESGSAIAAVEGHTGGVTAVAFDDTGNLLASGAIDASVALWDVRIPASPCRICTLYGFSDGRWAVIDPDGRFDASDAGDVPWLGWVVGMEPIALEQLKERYYEPRLLRKLLATGEHKLLGSGDESPRDVPALAEVDLYPGRTGRPSG
jgi:WD40 repeat protein